MVFLLSTLGLFWYTGDPANKSWFCQYQNVTVIVAHGKYIRKKHEMKITLCYPLSQDQMCGKCSFLKWCVFNNAACNYFLSSVVRFVFLRSS